MLKKAGTAIATSQRMVFHFSRFFFAELPIQVGFLPLWLLASPGHVRECRTGMRPPKRDNTSSDFRCPTAGRQL
jgi:hypothetical protein